MKVAIVHDWLTNYGGAETFVELWLRMYPQADIYTLVYDKKKMKGHFEGTKNHQMTDDFVFLLQFMTIRLRL